MVVTLRKSFHIHFNRMSPNSLVKTIKVSLKTALKRKKRGGGNDSDSDSDSTSSSDSEPDVVKIQEPEKEPEPKPVGGFVKHKTFPRGILRKTIRRKPVASVDPTFSRKKTMRIMTGTGQKKIRSTLKKEVKRMDDKTIRNKLVERKLISPASKANPTLLRKMYEEAVGAGLMKL